MEVSGKKLRNYCKPCEQLKTSTFSDGFCSQCAEEMCQRCFDTHKQFKLNRGHILVQSVEAKSKCKETPTFDNCTKHLNEEIKFFCPEHDQVGCGDCMVISHKTCKVKYILEHIDGYKDSKEFKKLKKDIEKYDGEAKAMLGRIRSNKDHVKDVNKKFAFEVNSFRDELIAHFTKLSDAMLKYGDDIMAADVEKIENLEKQNKGLVDETNDMKETLQSEADQPYKLFLSSLSYRQNLHLVRDQLERIKANNTIETNDFMPDCNLEKLMKTCKQLGVLHKPNESGAGLKEKTVKSNRATPMTKDQCSQTNQVTKDQCSQTNQSFLDRQLVCKNLIIDGDLISCAKTAKGDFGLLIDKQTLSTGDSFEIEIVSIGRNGAIGVVPDDYPNNRLPGLGYDSYGYHSDGKVFEGRKSGEKIGDAWKVGDRIKCTVNL
ncbi:transcription intermediary factor 1-alpha-like isoform X2 [Ruditapes philippinarum]|uniref:transcription intermediary factor 1-alpha-like isoform X2 n=1 Tax=Ruditapes philippinarum TaxID=129788 RepID=UPI00295AF30A|nr:transcription intermediary factor 1-alpha-like isoform X2 [Ruditapes philippinarum]